MHNSKFDTYCELSTQVYDLLRPEAPPDAYQFYRSYAEELKGKILEPMCGSGRFLLPLNEEGFEVDGFDGSEYMLGVLREKARIKKIRPNVWNSLVQTLQVPEKYNLIFIPSGSFGHIIELDIVMSSLQKIYEHLNKDGVFLFEVESSASVINQLNAWKGDIHCRADGKMIVANRLITLKEDICFGLVRYELLDSNQVIQSETELLKVRFYNDSQVLNKMLSDVGFKSIRHLKTFNREVKANVKDPAIVYECRK